MVMEGQPTTGVLISRHQGGARFATLSSAGSWYSHVTASSEGVVQVAARGVSEDSLDHTAQEEHLPKHSTSFPSETLKKQGPPDAELQGRFRTPVWPGV